MRFFTNCNTLDELKAEYRRLTKLHHPDLGGDAETMKAVNNEYAEVFEILKNSHNAQADEAHQTTEAPEEFIEIIDKLLKLDGLDIELCGSWIWIGGNTREHKDALKAAGCRWSKNKSKWYWRHEEDGYTWHRKGQLTTMSYIRSKYGSQHIVGAHHERYESLGAAVA